MTNKALVRPKSVSKSSVTMGLSKFRSVLSKRTATEMDNFKSAKEDRLREESPFPMEAGQQKRRLGTKSPATKGFASPSELKFLLSKAKSSRMDMKWKYDPHDIETVKSLSFRSESSNDCLSAGSSDCVRRVSLLSGKQTCGAVLPEPVKQEPEPSASPPAPGEVKNEGKKQGNKPTLWSILNLKNPKKDKKKELKKSNLTKELDCNDGHLMKSLDKTPPIHTVRHQSPPPPPPAPRRPPVRTSATGGTIHDIAAKIMRKPNVQIDKSQDDNIVHKHISKGTRKPTVVKSVPEIKQTQQKIDLRNMRDM